MDRRGACDDCAHACTDRCQRVSPGAQPRWAAFERCGLAEQYRVGGPRNAAYMDWISREWTTWRELNGYASRFLGELDHAAFDRWLAERHDVPAPLDCEAA